MSQSNPVPVARSLLSPLYISLYSIFSSDDLKNNCEQVLNQAFGFIHYYHPSKLSRWLHFVSIIPFFSGIFLCLAFFISATTGLEWSRTIVTVWTILYVIFAMGIDRNVALVMAVNCLGVYLACSHTIEKYGSSADVSVLIHGLIYEAVAIILQVIVGHLVVDKRTPAFFIQEGFVLAPIYITLRCVFMDNIKSYKPWRSAILHHVTAEKYQKFSRF